MRTPGGYRADQPFYLSDYTLVLKDILETTSNGEVAKAFTHRGHMSVLRSLILKDNGYCFNK